jgi:hypothetical protein
MAVKMLPACNSVYYLSAEALEEMEEALAGLNNSNKVSKPEIQSSKDVC